MSSRQIHPLSTCIRTGRSKLDVQVYGTLFFNTFLQKQILIFKSFRTFMSLFMTSSKILESILEDLGIAQFETHLTSQNLIFAEGTIPCTNI